VKHARHAIKVLMKFKLLELHSVTLRGLVGMAAQHAVSGDDSSSRFFGNVELDQLTDDIMAELDCCWSS
jgi:hypothetical protein